MRFVDARPFHSGDTEWRNRGLYTWITNLFNAPPIRIEPRCTGHIRSYLREELTNAGWSFNVRIDPNFDLTVTGRYRDLAFQIQTGNISRAMYDLLKLEFLHENGKIKAAALAVPTKAAAPIIGSNLANFGRVGAELHLFEHIIHLPILLISFE